MIKKIAFAFAIALIPLAVREIEEEVKEIRRRRRLKEQSFKLCGIVHNSIKNLVSSFLPSFNYKNKYGKNKNIKFQKN